MNAAQLEKLILKSGYTLQKHRGKGSHRVYKKEGCPDIILPYHSSKELSKGVENKIKKELGLK